MVYVKAIFRAGHVGTGKYHEMKRFLVVSSVVDVLSIAKVMPRVKKNQCALISCVKISRKEYHAGKQAEALDPYLKQTS